MAESGRRISRGVVRAYLSELSERGLLSCVRTRVSAATQSVIDASPRWIDGMMVEELLAAVDSAAGREVVRDLGRRAMRESVGPVLQPLIGFVLSFRTPDPGALFARADGMAAIVSEGTRLSWKRTGPREGTLTASCAGPVCDAWWAAWEGALSHAFVITGISGEISPARVAFDGRSAEIDTRWKEPAS